MTRIQALLIITTVSSVIPNTIDIQGQSRKFDPQGTPLNNVFAKAQPRHLASGHKTIGITPTGLYQGKVTVSVEKEKEKTDGWGGMCIESANTVNLSKYRFVTLLVEPTDVADKLEYKLEQGNFGASQELRLEGELKRGRVQLTVPTDATVPQGTNRFCAALPFIKWGLGEKRTLTFSDIRFWTQEPSQ